MKQLALAALIGLFAVSSIPAQLQSTSVQGTETHPYLIFLTHDDGFDEPAADGTTQTLAVAQELFRQGLPDTFFIVTCHFLGSGQPHFGTSMCKSSPDLPMTQLQQLADMGFVIGNHSLSHVSFNWIEQTLYPAADVPNDVRAAQAMLAPYQEPLGLHLMRCPGLDCGNMSFLMTQSDLKSLKGPIDADAGGGFVLDDGTQAGGDWWFYQNGKTPEETGSYYMRAITAMAPQHGIILLMHTRSAVMTGKDGSKQFPLKLVQYLLSNLDSRYTFAPLDGLPGMLGNIQTSVPEQISTEFGTNDGQGRVVAGNITGNEKGAASFCKAVDTAVRCIIRFAPRSNATTTNARSFSSIPFSKSTSWFDVTDTDWQAKFGSQFWLVDLNNDGRADLVLPSQAGLRVAYSNGHSGFTSAEPLIEGSFHYQTIRFADVNGDGLPDMVEWTPTGVLLYLNNHRGFDHPVTASKDFLTANGWTDASHLSTMQLGDVNGDGCADLVMRGAADTMVALSDCRSGFTAAQSWTKRFNDRQGFSRGSQNQTFSLAAVDGKVGLAAGLFTGGVVFQQADPQNQRFSTYRYIMDNRGFSGDPNFHTWCYASDLIFADVLGTGNTVPVQVRASGLYASHIRIVTQ
jgi:FG-GAP-like repeat/Polysaccharide deacetylase